MHQTHQIQFHFRASTLVRKTASTDRALIVCEQCFYARLALDAATNVEGVLLPMMQLTHHT